MLLPINRWTFTSLILWLWFGSAYTPLAADDLAVARRSPFRRSHVVARFDAPGQHRNFDVDIVVQDMHLVGEADVSKWREFVRALHAEGKLVCGELRPLTHMGKTLQFVMNDPGLQSAVCLDFERRPIPIGWITGEHTYQGKQPNFYCSSHPTFREFLRRQVAAMAEIGVDGIMIDDGGGTFFAYRLGGCFCDHCMEGFRDYLQQRFTPQRLRDGGIDDADRFHYHEFVRKYASDDESYRKVRGRIPWDREFQEFLVHTDVVLFEELHALARRVAGKHVPFGWDDYDFHGRRAPYYPLWDVFYTEVNYNILHVEGWGGPRDALPPGIVTLYKLADAVEKRNFLTPAPPSWAAIRDGNLTGLLRQWIAFSYANGGTVRYPRKGWCFKGDPWYYPPREEFDPLYAFVRNHHGLFDDYEAVAQVGVLYTQTRANIGAPYYSPLRHVCAGLVDANVPFGFVVAGDEFLSNRIGGDEAARFELVLVPEPIRLVDGQGEIVERWKQEGKAVAVTGNEDVAAILRGRVERTWSIEGEKAVWLFPRTNAEDASAPLVCHLVCSDYDHRSNRTRPQTDVTVRLRNAFLQEKPVQRITYYTIRSDSLELPIEREGNGLRVTVPEVKLWGILKVEH